MKFTKFCIKLYYLSYKLQFLCVWKQVQEDSLCFGENGLSYHNTILCLFSVPSLSYVCLMNRDWAAKSQCLIQKSTLQSSSEH